MDHSCCNLLTPLWPTKLLKDMLFLKVAFYLLPNLSAPPPQCFNCQQVGHIARHCKSGTICGLCAKGHDTCQCGTAQKDHPIDQITPLNCAGCQGPHAASDKNCPIRRAAVYQHWCNITDKGRYFPVMPSTQRARWVSSPSCPDTYRETE